MSSSRANPHICLRVFATEKAAAVSPVALRPVDNSSQSKSTSAGPCQCSSLLVWFHTAEQGLASVPSCGPAWAEAGGCLRVRVYTVSYPLPCWACNSAPAAVHQMSTSRKPCPDNQVQIMLCFVSPHATSTQSVLHVKIYCSFLTTYISDIKGIACQFGEIRSFISVLKFGS